MQFLVFLLFRLLREGARGEGEGEGEGNRGGGICASAKVDWPQLRILIRSV